MLAAFAVSTSPALLAQSAPPWPRPGVLQRLLAGRRQVSTLDSPVTSQAGEYTNIDAVVVSGINDSGDIVGGSASKRPNAAQLTTGVGIFC